MSVVRGFGLNGKSFYTNVCKPCDVNLNYIVDSTNANGLGMRSLKSNGYVESVFMHTTQTPGVVGGITNPNPVSGYALVTFKSNFNYFLNSFSGQVCPLTSTSTTSVTVNNVYSITALGNTTLAQWQAAGLPMGFTPTVGQSFIAIATGAIGGTGTVGLPSTPVGNSMSIVGDPNQQISNSNISKNAGARILIQFSDPAVTMASYTPAGTNSAPTFTGSALANHTHNLLLKNAAVADGATTRVNAGANLLGANTGSDITVTGAGANGGVVNASAGTPAGTVSAPTFTGTPAVLTGTVAYAVTSPANGTTVSMTFKFDASSVTIDGI